MWLFVIEYFEKVVNITITLNKQIILNINCHSDISILSKLMVGAKKEAYLKIHVDYILEYFWHF